MPPEIREPRQNRSKEKKSKIIKAGFELFCEKGYHNTNTAEIAKRAGVSTGVVYNYFEDKKAIFIQAIEIFADEIAENVFSKLNNMDHVDNLQVFIRRIIDDFIKIHYEIAVAHEELEAMGHLYPEVARIYHKFEMQITMRVTDIVKKYTGTEKSDLKERVHLVYGLIENLCHEQVFHRHEELDYDAMAEIVTEAVMNILI